MFLFSGSIPGPKRSLRLPAVREQLFQPEQPHPTHKNGALAHQAASMQHVWKNVCQKILPENPPTLSAWTKNVENMVGKELIDVLLC